MANGLIDRKNVDRLDAAALTALRDAYGKMMALRQTDNRSWVYWAGLHGYPQWSCWHHGRVASGSSSQEFELFLPWHRAYLSYFEQAVRDQNAAAVLPWWDWASDISHQNGVPQAFSDQSAGNSLLSGPVPRMNGDPDRKTRRFPAAPDQLPTSEDVAGLLSATGFLDFSRQLENIHDGIHGWTGGDGGDMSVIATAAYDPIFWSHHCMIDRLWYLWQLRHGLHNIPPSYLDIPLAPFSLKVRDVLDIHQLGYEYSSGSVEVSAAGAAVHAHS